ncbi:MAG: ABC transporter ATP-binding protein [Leptolyngbya sp. SIO1E4]|nr:ABC transporter ATP-binding protein [Leptolyngbya sp. SIO1E4]
MLLLVVQGLLPAASVVLTRQLVDSLVMVGGTGIDWETVQTILLPTALMAGILLATQVLGSVSELIRTMQAELVQDHISHLVHDQSIVIDFGCYESSEYNDQLDRARSGAGSRSLALLESSGSLLQNSITLLAVATLLLSYGVWLPFVLLGSALPTFYVVVRLNRLQYQWSQRTTIDRRRLQYFELLLTHAVVAAELRLFNFGPHFRESFQTLRRRLRTEQFKLIRDQSISRFCAGLIALVLAGGVLSWMGRQVLAGTVTLGDLALFYQAFTRGQNVVKSALSSLGQIYKNSLFISNLFQFLSIKPQIADPPHPLPIPKTLHQGIRFNQVTFRYPGSSEAVLKDFNLTIPAGNIVAIVGDNGAGKSTLLKLLCRFYDPETGSIELDGTDIRRFPLQPLRRLITVLFQSPMTYQLPANENIALGDLTAIDQQERIQAAAADAGIHDKLTRLPQQYDTLLGKWFPGGTDLSGGEWQRISLARAFFRKAPIIVLDEPTSAMDPWAEADWLDRFRRMASGRTAIVITHRFTLAMRADQIHVMRAGSIVESGTHAQLLEQDGLYAESWRSQMQAPSISAGESEEERPKKLSHLST